MQTFEGMHREREICWTPGHTRWPRRAAHSEQCQGVQVGWRGDKSQLRQKCPSTPRVNTSGDARSLTPLSSRAPLSSLSGCTCNYAPGGAAKVQGGQGRGQGGADRLPPCRHRRRGHRHGHAARRDRERRRSAHVQLFGCGREDDAGAGGGGVQPVHVPDGRRHPPHQPVHCRHDPRNH